MVCRTMGAGIVGVLPAVDKYLAMDLALKVRTVIGNSLTLPGLEKSVHATVGNRIPAVQLRPRQLSD
jgi:hypothetical protein